MDGSETVRIFRRYDGGVHPVQLCNFKGCDNRASDTMVAEVIRPCGHDRLIFTICPGHGEAFADIHSPGESQCTSCGATSRVHLTVIPDPMRHAA